MSKAKCRQPSLAEVLKVGNHTGGKDIVLDGKDVIRGDKVGLRGHIITLDAEHNVKVEAGTLALTNTEDVTSASEHIASELAIETVTMPNGKLGVTHCSSSDSAQTKSPVERCPVGNVYVSAEHGLHLESGGNLTLVSRGEELHLAQAGLKTLVGGSRVDVTAGIVLEQSLFKAERVLTTYDLKAKKIKLHGHVIIDGSLSTSPRTVTFSNLRPSGISGGATAPGAWLNYPFNTLENLSECDFTASLSDGTVTFLRDGVFSVSGFVTFFALNTSSRAKTRLVLTSGGLETIAGHGGPVYGPGVSSINQVISVKEDDRLRLQYYSTGCNPSGLGSPVGPDQNLYATLTVTGL